MNPDSADQFESFVAVYDAIPENWEQGRQFITERLKEISNSLNAKTIGFLLDEELLSGQQFVPSNATALIDGTAPQFRSVLRIVINCSPLLPGTNTFPHGITFDANFTLIDLWATGTNSTALLATVFSNSDTIRLTATDVIITSDENYNNGWAFIEYTQEP